MAASELKILFLSRFQNRVDRGVETYVAELSKRLSKHHRVTIFSGKDSDSLIKICQQRWDVVIATNGRMQALKASLARIFNKSKLIISGQSGIGRDDIWNLAICTPNVYVAITELEKRWAKKWGWLSRIVKINNGVDLDKFKPIGAKIDFGLEGPIILSVGALEWYKYHQRSIEAVSRLDEGSLVIIGQGSQQKRLTEMGCRLLGEKRFKIMTVPFDRIADYYRSADLFVLPSWNRESFGIVYLEAMASGLSVVAPDDLSRREIVGDGGILVDVADNQKYAQAIKSALGRKWADLPRMQAEKFSWDIVAEEYQKLFEAIC